MDIYNIFLVLIWIPILILCKKKILKFFNLDKKSNNEEKYHIEHNKLLEDIEKEYSDIQMVFDTEILSIKDELMNKNFPIKIKKDIIEETIVENDNENINMYKIFNKSLNILKELFLNIIEKIKSYFTTTKN